MAQKTHIAYVSDLSGKEITDNDKPTIEFGWDGSAYTIDLTSDEAEKMHAAMEKYLSVATKVSGSRKSTRKASNNGPKPADVRAWAKENGHDVPGRGRIPESVREAYDAAH